MSPTDPTATTGTAGARAEVDAALDRWMRHEAAAVHVRLLHRYGWARAELVADALQEALLRATESWPFRGVPDRPSGWLFTVASRWMLDVLGSANERHGASLDLVLDQEDVAVAAPAAVGRGELADPDLAVLFALCHPSLPTKSAIALTLQVLCGFSLREIESALLMKPDAVAQRLARAKRTLRDIPDIAIVPSGEALPTRLAVALDVIGLIFNEGFEPSSGDRTMRADLCAEALRLADALARHPETNMPETRALAALLNLLFARLPARLADPGTATLLAEQDRSLWSHDHLRRGFGLLAESAHGEHVSRYHLLAGIAATHAAAASLAETDWDTIVATYRLLIDLEDSPVHRLNFAVALLHAGQVTSAGEEIEHLAAHPVMQGYFWFQVTRAEIRRASGDCAGSRAALDTALTLAKTPGQAYDVRQKIARIECVLPSPGKEQSCRETSSGSRFPHWGSSI